MLDEADTKNILAASSLDDFRRTLGRPRTMWMKTIQKDLKSNNLSLNEALDMAQNHPLWRLMPTLGTVHSYRRVPESIVIMISSITGWLQEMYRVL